MIQVIDAKQFVKSFEGITDRQSPTFVDIGGQFPLPIRAWPSKGAKALVVFFHGNVDRQTRIYPPHLAFRRGLHHQAHQISLSDPSLALSDELSIGWFAGSEGTPLQMLLPPFLELLSSNLDVDRVIFVGGSGGGFAALYYSWRHKGSAVVAFVPQTNIYAYYKGPRQAYLKTAWPAEFESIQNRPCLDLRAVYSQGSDNTVVYLQSSRDLFHLEHQMTPFLSSMPDGGFENVALRCSFWGKSGHSGTVPTAEMETWVRALLLSHDMSAESATRTHYEVFGADATSGTATVTPKSGNINVAASGPARRDAVLADRIANSVLAERG